MLLVGRVCILVVGGGSAATLDDNGRQRMNAVPLICFFFFHCEIVLHWTLRVCWGCLSGME